jgi:subtilisin family serine protease
MEGDGSIMKKYIYIVLSLLMVSCGSEKNTGILSDTSDGDNLAQVASQSISSPRPEVSIQSILSDMDHAEFVNGEVLVKFRPDVSATASAATHLAKGSTVVKRAVSIPNFERVRLPEGVSVRDAVADYMSDPNVDYAVPNYIVRAFSTIPNDEFFNNQWALRNTGQYADGIAGSDIKAADGWDYEKGSRDIVIAVIDTGVDYTHIEFVDNIWNNTGETDCNDGIDNDDNDYIDDCIGWDFTTCDQFGVDETCETITTEDNDPMDESGHGTHVAGIIGARGNNGDGIAGVMWNVRIMPLRFLNSQGLGDFFDAVNAVDYARMNGADIINASFGGSGYVPEFFDSVAAARDAGVLFVAAAGNDGTNNDEFPMYPASFNLANVLTVASTNQRDTLSSFSNFGTSTVHVGAPGEYILSTQPPGISFADCANSAFVGYDFCFGTSMAAPHVAGLAGLILSFYPDFSYLQAKWTIIRYVDIIQSLQSAVFHGGRINAYKALTSLLTPTGLFANSTSTQISLSWSDLATGEDGYTIEMSMSGGVFSPIGNTGPGIETFTHSGIDPSNTYSYRVSAFNTIPANSEYSNVAVVPAAPSGLAATTISNSRIDLAWDDNSNNEWGFKIERKSGVPTGGGTYAEIAQVGQNVTTFSSTELDKDNNYTFRVRAFTDTGNSAFSNEATNKTPGSSGGNSGLCSIGSRTATPTALLNIAVILLPLAIITVLRLRRKFRGR